MPRDGVKSYRSFVTCDDPKGVVDCNIIKKSKVNSQKMEQKIKTHRTSRNSNKLLVSQEEKEELISKEMRERFHGQSSLPLMEVYRGAEKLNKIVDSWSKGMRSDRKSEDIAEDLLEGTSSLKESLIMLAKLQEASNQSVRLKMKYQRSFPCQLQDQSFPVEFQRSKLSRHGSSRNGADEIKKVIKDSLVRKDVTHNATVSERSCFHDINSDSGLEIPSSSSSPSSTVNDNVNCCHVSTSPQKHLSRNNLIAKLMGLEEISSRPVQTTLKKEFEFETISGYKTSLYANDMTPKAQRSKSVINKENPEKGTLREIFETIPLNRLIESNSDKEFKLHCPHSYNNVSKQRLKDVPPIVLLKPMHLPPNELEKHRAHVSPKEEAFNQKAILRNMKKKELCSFDDSDFRGGILISDKLHRKQEAEGIPLKQITQEVRIPKHKEVWKLRKGVVDTKKNAAEKLKTSSPMHDMPHVEEPIDKNVLTSKKVTAATRKPVGKELAKKKVVSSPQHQEKVTSTNPRKNKTHTQRSSAARAMSNDLNCQKKERAALAHSEAKSLTRIVEAKKDDESTDTNESAELPINRNTTTLRSLITMERETEECDTKIIECCKESLNSLSPLSPKLEIDASIAEVIDSNGHTETDIKSCNQGTNLKALLLSSSSFLSQAGEHFDLNLNVRTKLQASCCNDTETPNTKPLIDCAIELVERKGHPDLQVANSLFLGYRSNTKIEISIEKLVEDVCDDIDTLTSYRTICGENLVVDTLYAVLERDLCCKELMNGMWDFGWKNGFPRSESEQIVNGIEKLILSGLIEESI